MLCFYETHAFSPVIFKLYPAIIQHDRLHAKCICITCLIDPDLFHTALPPVQIDSHIKILPDLYAAFNCKNQYSPVKIISLIHL